MKVCFSDDIKLIRGKASIITCTVIFIFPGLNVFHTKRGKEGLHPGAVRTHRGNG